MKASLQIQIARIDAVLPTLPADPNSWLSPSEQARLQRLQIPSRRNQYLSGHWLARGLLAQQHGGQAQDWILRECPSLPPTVIGHDTATYLSLSHSGDWIACALSDLPVGIDIEQRQPPRDALLRFQHLLLAEGELPDTLTVDELLQRWVTKEAFVKQHHGSALPDELGALRLQRVTGETANVRMVTTEGFHLGVAADRAAAWDADSGHSILARTMWHVGKPGVYYS